MANVLLQTISLLSTLIIAYGQNPDKCLGEFQYCKISGGGVCAMDCANATLCKNSQYVCPISKHCIDKVEDYVNCPQLKGTHLDWNLTLEERVNFLVNNMTLNEKYPQLTNVAPGVNRLGIPFYNYRSNDIHSIAGVQHSTVFPDGCGLGGTWSKQDAKKVAYQIGFEQRSLHNAFVHQGNRNPNDGGAITNNGPNINLVRDPRWGRSQEVYSEDPRLGAHLAYAVVTGMQYGGLQNDKYYMMGLQCKHYAVYNLESIPESRTHFNAITDAVNWAETYSPAFRECVVRANAAQVMCSYNSVNGVPACGNHDILTSVLRDQWGLKGYVVSDYDAMEQIYSSHHYANSSEQAAAIGIKAGCDMEGGGKTAINTIPQGIKDGMLSINDINLAFSRIIRTRILLGMFDPPTFVEYNQWYNSSEVEGKDALNLARLVASKSIGLYKNNANILPLSTDNNNMKGIALIGPYSINTNSILGNYCSYPDKGVPTILGALREELEGIKPTTNCTFENNIVYQQPDNNIEYETYSPQECCDLCFEANFCNYWTFAGPSSCWLKSTNSGKQSSANHVSGECLNKNEIKNSKLNFSLGCPNAACTDTSQFGDALNLIKNMYSAGKLSVVLIGLGLDQSIEREGHDRSSIELPGHQNDLVSYIYNYTSQINIPIICYLIHGGTVALGDAYDECDAILDAWYPGQMGAYGLSDVIFGKYNPAGRASVTYYTSTNVLPPMGNMNEYPNGGKYGITYRYFNKKDGILIPFGFGLSYTQFKYSDLSLNITKNGNDYTLDDPCGVIQISFNVTNSGDIDGDEVVQIYVKQPHATVPVPQIRLGDFERVEIIKSGETRNVKLILTPRYRSSVFNKTSKNWYTPDIQIEKGIIELYVGGGQPDNPFKGYLSTNVSVTQSASFYNCDNQD
eukprot:75902_1